MLIEKPLRPLWLKNNRNRREHRENTELTESLSESSVVKKSKFHINKEVLCVLCG
jgi:hypothetical protein